MTNWCERAHWIRLCLAHCLLNGSCPLRCLECNCKAKITSPHTSYRLTVEFLAKRNEGYQQTKTHTHTTHTHTHTHHTPTNRQADTTHTLNSNNLRYTNTNTHNKLWIIIILFDNIIILSVRSDKWMIESWMFSQSGKFWFNITKNLLFI